MQTQIKSIHLIRRLALLLLVFFFNSNSIVASELITWSFSNGDVRGIILPSVHYLDKSSSFDSRSLKLILDSTRRIYFETGKQSLKIEPPLIVNTKVMYCERGVPCGKELTGKEGWNIIKNILKNQPELLKTASKLKAWSLSMLLGQKRNQSVSNKGTEFEVLVLNAQYRYPVYGLETRYDLYNHFNNLPNKAQLTMLKDALKKESEYFAQLKIISDSWANGCISCLCKISDELLKSRPEYSHEIVYKRNMKWVDSITNLKTEDPILVVVGVAHVCGDESLINLMQSVGFSVNR